MDKEELIDLLKKGAYWEDEFIARYDSASFWALIEASVSKEKFGKIKELFNQNIKESYKHSAMLKNLMEKINKNGQ
jgi:hypothetical protein